MLLVEGICARAVSRFIGLRNLMLRHWLGLASIQKVTQSLACCFGSCGTCCNTKNAHESTLMDS
ncbi:hypothetical protein BISA_1590 [Bifidobacterium saguini DSM 23967]|uniref:Uncharacterized protein n=1 Tax=Bifidobacterium saguini DSM 23967 TaxID=1437607 RepID=A0A087DDA2_9BIFI|nr:hypothetical protein BISA_1590 [Bifidobacterium saguini DSM 23967]